MAKIGRSGCTARFLRIFLPGTLQLWNELPPERDYSMYEVIKKMSVKVPKGFASPLSKLR